MLTVSEQLFERLCQTRAITYKRIPEGRTKTPDYQLMIDSVNILVEVKQLDENDGDRRINEALCRRDDTPGVECPSNRVRLHIVAAYRQLKAYHRAGLATGIVLHNNAGPLTYIDSWTVTKAMFGDYGYRFGIPVSPRGPIVDLGAGFMGKRKVTRNTCRVLSFVSVLRKDSSNTLVLEAYHNPFATVPLPPSVMSSIASSQFIHDNPHDGKWVHWQPKRLDLYDSHLLAKETQSHNQCVHQIAKKAGSG